MGLNKNQGIIITVLFVFFMFYKPSVCFLMVGSLVLYYVIKSVSFLDEINKNGIEIVGKIVSYESDNEGYKTPVIEFETVDGKNLIGKPYIHASSDLDKFQSYSENINKNIRIIYSPESPEKFIIKNSSPGCVLIFGAIVGLVFIILAAGSLLGHFDIFN